MFQKIAALTFASPRFWQCATVVIAALTAIILNLCVTGFVEVLDALPGVEKTQAESFAEQVVNWETAEQILSACIAAALLIGLARMGVAPGNIIEIQKKLGLDKDGWVGPKTTARVAQISDERAVLLDAIRTIASSSDAKPEEITRAAQSALAALDPSAAN